MSHNSSFHQALIQQVDLLHVFVGEADKSNLTIKACYTDNDPGTAILKRAWLPGCAVSEKPID